mgnify:CR=1 FL=1
MLIVNVAGATLIGLIAWWFWMYKAKEVALDDAALVVVVENGTYHPARIKLAANQATDNIVVFRIDQETGKLRPTGIAVDAGGNLFVVDTDHNRLCKVTPAGTMTVVWGTGWVQRHRRRARRGGGASSCPYRRDLRRTSA